MARRAAHRNVDVSVIIVNYNVREYLSNALRSLSKALKGVRSEVIVVDNASSDGSVEHLRRQFPRVRFIALRENIGFGRANNLAMSKARGKFFLLLNPDTLVQEDTVKVMLRYFREHERVGLAGCRILNPDGTFQLAARRSYPTPWIAFTRITGLSRMFPGSRLFGRYNLTYLPTDQSYPVEAISGSCMFMRRSACEAVGGFDERFFMYGEDLDLCYRVREAGWEVHYVHETSIIHYKGESTRRSAIDEIAVFYEAMRIFVEKHFGTPGVFLWMLKMGIRLATFGAWLGAYARRAWPALLDTVILLGSLLLSEYLRKGMILSFPDYAYPSVYIVPVVLMVGTLMTMGVYTHRSMSISRTVTGVVVSFVMLAALTAFVKEFAFSRAVLLTSGLLCILLTVGWRVLFRIITKGTPLGRSSLFGRRAVVVGTGDGPAAIARKLRVRAGSGYDVVGYVQSKERSPVSDLNGSRVLGNVTSIRKVIRAFSITDVIVAPDAMSNKQLLEMISSTSGIPVSFHLVAGSMEFLISKASVESLDDVPLVEVTYNIEKRRARTAKRVLDLAVSLVGLTTVYPFVYLFRRRAFERSTFVRLLPKVLAGSMSLVGPPEELMGSNGGMLFLGKPGLTGLVQLQSADGTSLEEKEQLMLRYARTQSFLLDLEILLTFVVERMRSR